VNLVLDTVRLAMKREKKRVAAEPQLHSDQGFPYTSRAYFKRTQEYGITLSMSRRGNCSGAAYAVPLRLNFIFSYKNALLCCPYILGQGNLKCVFYYSKGANDMPEFKEKPQMGRPKAKPPSAMHPKQAARMMKEKYLQQLDQCPEGADSEAGYATDQVEGAGRGATDEAVSHAPRPRQHRKNAPKERSCTEGESDPTEGRATQEPKQQPKCDATDTPNRGRDPASRRPTLPKSARPPP